MAYLKNKFTLFQEIDKTTTKRIECYQFDKFSIGKINLFPSKESITVQLFNKSGCEYWRDIEEVLFTTSEHDDLIGKIKVGKLVNKMELLK